MYTPSDKIQFQAHAVGQGKHTLTPVHHEIMSWVSQRFGVTALDFACEMRETPNGHQQIVHVIVSTGADVAKIHTQRDATALVAQKFLEYFKSPPEDADPLKSSAFPPATTPFPEVVVTYRPLKEVSSDIRKEMCEDEQRLLLSKYESVWTKSQHVIFYHSIDQVSSNELNGTSKHISESLNRIAAKFGFVSDCAFSFDSKESFDRDYQGNWYYYWK